MSGSSEVQQLPQSSLDREQALKIYLAMLRSRLFDEFVNAKIAEGREAPHFHSGIGQEALSVAGVSLLRSDDYMIYSHRGYAHLIAKGVSIRTLMLDMMHKSGGSNDGFGGVLHISAPSIGVVGRNGAFGTNFGVAVGLAMSAVKRRNGRVVVVYYGEAAGARGPLYEALNMAVLWKLPIVLIAENNGYSISSRTESLYPKGRMSAVWRGFDIQVDVIDGNDAIAVYEAASRAVHRARNGDGPSVIEGLTYRIDPHRPVIDDHLLYRSPDEIANWIQKDPVKRLRASLFACRWLPPSMDNEQARNICTEIDSAWRDAENADPPSQEMFDEKVAWL